MTTRNALLAVQESKPNLTCIEEGVILMCVSLPYPIAQAGAVTHHFCLEYLHTAVGTLKSPPLGVACLGGVVLQRK